MKSYMQATMERDRQKAEKAELDRLRAVNKELVEALRQIALEDPTREWASKIARRALAAAAVKPND